LSERKSFDSRVKDFQREFFKKKIEKLKSYFDIMLPAEAPTRAIKAAELIDPIIECIGFAFPEDCVNTCCKVISYVFCLDTSKWLEEYRNSTKISLTGKERTKDYKPIEETGFYRDRKRSPDKARVK
jgi:hypothetical protein